jgi:DNA-binding beta-propeller fold protein YncE
MKRSVWPVVLVLSALPVLAGCAAEAWKVKQITAAGQLAVPECCLVDTQTGKVFVSNMDTDSGAYWADDGKGSIALLAPGGTPIDIRWQVSTKDVPMHSPKGMTIYNRVLYVADNSRVLGFPLTEARGVKPLKGPTGEHLNDMATDGEAVYVSDTAAGVVYRMAPDGVTRVKAPAGVNGITCFKEKMYAVSWDLHEVYELDPTGQGDPVPMGLSGHFTTPDGIEVLDDGTILVSDMHGNRVAAIAPDRKHVYTLVEIETPADIGLDRDRMLLYIPQFERDCITVCRLIPVED